MGNTQPGRLDELRDAAWRYNYTLDDDTVVTLADDGKYEIRGHHRGRSKPDVLARNKSKGEALYWAIDTMHLMHTEYNNKCR